MAESEQLRDQMMEIQQTTLSLTTLYVRATALALLRHRDFQKNCLGSNGSIDIGIGIFMNDRVITPTLQDCERKNIAELADEIQQITHQIFTGLWKTEDNSDAAFSIIHLGMYPIEQFIPILSSSQRATLSIGAIRNARLQDDGIAAIDRRAAVTLTCQESSFDEKEASEFLDTLRHILERPLAIFLPNRVE